jgi:protein-tyrosine phosphatase
VETDLHWDACWNIRDLGGHATESGRVTRQGRVVRAGNLSRLTEHGRDALIAYGVRTVIDLRDPRELDIELDPFHERGRWAGLVRYFNVPLISEDEWTAIRDPVQRKRGYQLTFELSRKNIGRAMSAVATAEGAVAIHCHAGKERTGVVAALLLALVGVPDEHIGADYVESDRHLSGLYDEWAQRETDPDERESLRRSFQSEAAHITGPLEYLRSLGSVENYLVAAGVAAGSIARLRSRLID